MRFLFVVVLISLTGCVSGYHQFYEANPSAAQIIARRESPPPATPAADQAYGDPEEVFAEYARYGYAPIGFASFNSGWAESDASAVAQGRRVGADLVVIMQPRYTETRTGSVPITTPTTSTSYTHGTATAYGPGGTTTAYGSATTTTYGTSTTYVPFSVNRYDYGAIFYVKTRPRFGAYYRDLNSDERQRLQSNKGVAITLIIDKSPAYRGDFLDGDIITAGNGQSIAGAEGMSNFLDANAGQVVEFTVVRAGTVQVRSVRLND
jgi:hypothetical protein